jgi:hypothetical protein
MNLRALLRGAIALVVGLAFASPHSARAEGTSENFGQIHFSKYFLNNNVWGRADSPAGWNAIWNSNNTSPVWWGTAYNWPVNGNPNSVKAYPSIISGWHWGTWSANSGLPVRIWENKNLSTGASFTIQNAGVQNVAYDCWFHTIPNPTWENQPTDELMVWVSSYGGAGPLGTLQETVWIAGQQWRVYKGNIGWNVYSFVRTTNTDSWSFNLRDFVNHVTYNKGWMANSKYVTSVQFGTEVFSTTGNGQINVSNYRLDVN